jgi:hypothetical protein
MARMDQQATPTADEIAAAIAAISIMIEEDTLPEQKERGAWIGSARLIVQRMPPRRVRTAPSWRSAERLRRAMRDGFTGVTGL